MDTTSIPFDITELATTPQFAPDNPETTEVKRPKRAGFTKNHNQKPSKARRLQARHSRRINRGR